MNIKFIQIVARSSNGVIGNGDDIPWKLPKDLAYFKEKNNESNMHIWSYHL